MSVATGGISLIAFVAGLIITILMGLVGFGIGWAVSSLLWSFLPQSWAEKFTIKYVFFKPQHYYFISFLFSHPHIPFVKGIGLGVMTTTTALQLEGPTVKLLKSTIMLHSPTRKLLNPTFMLYPLISQLLSPTLML